ncbi:hypothetical protein [Aliiroseovarius subalbicans]|uniref:hypothetical protein n=1 Tax=Aliiroseovarius subalbicans TaxID=2925840 RepID=UPI001F5A5240|nr:hypothetical protein [Aliiroseovarius subalbicans]MCI2400047.1 hypothetical protein [Aliiroseovarius subalbicans]
MQFKRSLISSTLMIALALPVASISVVAFSAEPAFAGNGKSDKARGKSERPEKTNNGRGSIRSELKGANASNASETALANASPNSRVGMAAAYRDASVEALAAAQTAEDSAAAINALIAGYAGRNSSDIQTEIDNLAEAVSQEERDALDLELAAAQAHESELSRLEGEAQQAAQAAAEAALAEEDTLASLTDGRSLSDAALAELRSNLGL